MATPITNIWDQLRRDEGKRNTLYWLEGVPHIGYGHNLAGGPALSDVAIERVLHDDVALLEGQCAMLITGWATLSEARRGVLLNLGYRIGFHGLQGFTRMLQAVALGDWTTAAQEIRESDLAHQSDPERTARLAAQMQDDTWH